MKHILRSCAATCVVALFPLLQLSSQAYAGPMENFTEARQLVARGDVVTALPLLRGAADAGHAGAQALLAQLLDASDFDEEAIGYYRKSAQQGNADGQFGLGAMLAAGEGEPKNLAEGRKWITLAAEQGHALAVNELALAYIMGGLGISEAEQGSASALRWIRAAADGGYLTAMDRLAAAYKAGDYGLPVDAKLAKEWEVKIAKIRNIPQGRRGNRGAEKKVLINDK